MHKICCVDNCFNSSQKGQGLSFFHFPSNEERSILWQIQCGRKDFLHKSAKQFSSSRNVICEEHFTGDQFLANCKTKLLKTAIPTVFPNKKSQKRKITLCFIKDSKLCMTKSEVEKTQDVILDDQQELDGPTGEDNDSSLFCEDQTNSNSCKNADPRDSTSENKLSAPVHCVSTLKSVENQKNQEDFPDCKLEANVLTDENDQNHFFYEVQVDNNTSERARPVHSSVAPVNIFSSPPCPVSTMGSNTTRQTVHFLGPIDVTKLPDDWLISCKTSEVLVIKFREDSPVMSLKVMPNGKVFMKVFNSVLSTAHPINNWLLNSCLVYTFQELLEILRGLDRWTICSGNNDKILFDLMSKNLNFKGCVIIPQTLSLHSDRCEVIFPMSMDKTMCFMCKGLRTRLKKIIEGLND